MPNNSPKIVVDRNLVTQHKLFRIGTRLITEEYLYYRYSLDSDGYKWIPEDLWDKILPEWGSFILETTSCLRSWKMPNVSSKTVAVAFRIPVEVYNILLRRSGKQRVKISAYLAKRVEYDTLRKH